MADLCLPYSRSTCMAAKRDGPWLHARTMGLKSGGPWPGRFGVRHVWLRFKNKVLKARELERDVRSKKRIPPKYRFDTKIPYRLLYSFQFGFTFRTAHIRFMINLCLISGHWSSDQLIYAVLTLFLDLDSHMYTYT